mgnify:CR=1 FL=1
MEVWTKDHIADLKCAGKKNTVIALVHQHLGLASVVMVTNVPEKQALELTIASGSILVDYDLTTVLA